MATIPDSVLYDTELRPTHKVVYCYLTQRPHTMLIDIVRTLKLNARTASSALQQLQNRGHIQVTRLDRCFVISFPEAT